MIFSDTEMMELGIKHTTNIHNTKLLICTLKYVLDNLQTEEAITVKECTHTHTPTHTHRHTQTHTHARTHTLTHTDKQLFLVLAVCWSALCMLKLRKVKLITEHLQ